MERFSEVTSGVKWFKDNTTGLEWSETCSKVLMWPDTADWCASIGGRLPSVVELFGVVDHSLHMPSTILPGTRSGGYWSSSTYVKNPCGTVWVVDFYDGRTGLDTKGSNNYVRAVRSGSLG